MPDNIAAFIFGSLLAAIALVVIGGIVAAVI
jgi:hypothetical protein